MPRGAELVRIAQVAAPAAPTHAAPAHAAPAHAAIAMPARDEEATIGVSLRALARAEEQANTDILVLVNNTSDTTFEAALSWGTALGLRLTVADVRLHATIAHVGTARRLAMDTLAEAARPDAALITTDADSICAPGWIASNRAELRRGAALVCGRIEIAPDDTAALPAEVLAASAEEARYLALMRALEALVDPDPWNPSAHHGGCNGASIATTPAYYRRVGGLPVIPSSEDRAFLQRFRAHDLPIVFSDTARVVVSGRTAGRAPGGMAEAIAARIANPDARIDSVAEPANDWSARLQARAASRRSHGRGDSLGSLCDRLGIAPDTAARICASPTFGAAWQLIEAASRFRIRRHCGRRSFRWRCGGWSGSSPWRGSREPPACRFPDETPTLPRPSRGAGLAAGRAGLDTAGMVDPLVDILASVPVSAAAKDELRACLAEPSRAYHGTAHVALLWQRHVQYGAGLAVRSEPWNTRLACAIAYHDALYDAQHRDNEARSAAMWRSAGPALPEEDLEWVAGTILATADHLGAVPEPGMTPESWAARAWMLDLDLTPLGEEPAMFDANTSALRHEFGHLSDEAWAKGRAAFLRTIAAAPRLFRTPVLQAAFEARARANFAREGAGK
jgi:predicted metal-dependent HD superfamily phosphohydrolase